MVWIYVLYSHKRMILDEIDSPGILEADKKINALIGNRIDKKGDVDKRNDIGCYAQYLFPKQYLEDLSQNICSH